MTDRKPRLLNALTGLRFIAAAGIVVSHSGWFQLKTVEFAYTNFNLGLFVQLFFVLSGFILMYNYPELPTNAERGRFLLARLARIWPVHALAFVLFIIVSWKVTAFPVINEVSGMGAAAVGALNLTMLQSWIPILNVVQSFNAPSWSISTEFGFYLFFPLLIQKWKQTWWIKMALVCSIPFGFYRLAQKLGMPDGDPSGAHYDQTALAFNTLINLPAFVIGMGTALVWQRLPSAQRPARMVGTLFEIFASALVLAIMYEPTGAAIQRFYFSAANRCGVFSAYFGSLYPCLLAAVMAFLIVVMACEKGWISPILKCRAFVYLGEISFTIYIMHFVCIRYYVLHQSKFAKLSHTETYLAFWLALLVVCSIIYFCWEKPARKWIMGLWPKSPGVQKMSASQPTRSLWVRLAHGLPINFRRKQST